MTTQVEGQRFEEEKSLPPGNPQPINICSNSVGGSLRILLVAAPEGQEEEAGLEQKRQKHWERHLRFQQARRQCTDNCLLIAAITVAITAIWIAYRLIDARPPG